MENKSKVIAIDGPSGSGKSTIAKLLSKQLGLTYLDTGSMFRAIGHYLNKEGISFTDVDKISEALNNIKFEYSKDANTLVAINGENLTDRIREHHVSKLASQISQVMVVRNYLKTIQREIASQRPSVLEGRDIGTVIFPDAALKIFLTADGMVRAKRRLEQLKEQDPGISHSVDEIYHDILKRDETDAKRKIAPLVKADDAIELDTTHLTINEVVQKISESFEKNKHLFS